MKKNRQYPVSLLFIGLAVLLFASCKVKQSGSDASSKKSSGTQLDDRDRVNFERVFFDANKEKILNNYDLAETLFLQALHIDPNSTATMYELANIYSFQSNKNQALYYSKKAALGDPSNIYYQELYADCLNDNKMPEEAAKVFEKAIRDYPQRIEYYFQLANDYLAAGKMNEALKVYDRVEQQFGVNEDASMQKLKIYKAQKNLDKSLEEVQKLIKAYPKEAKYYSMLGDIYQDKGMSDKALAAYNDLLKIDPDNAYVHLSLADYYRNLKQNDKAFDEIKAAFRNRDLDIDTKVKILLSYYDITENYPELKSDADTLCKIIVQVHPTEAKAFSIYGDFLYRDKKLAEARVQYRKAIDLDKEKYALWNQLLMIESDLNDINALEKESKETIELFPNQPLAYFFNGAANIQLKNYKEAIDVLTEGKEFVFDNKPFLAQFFANIGDAKNQMGDHSGSDEAYDKALDTDPNNVYVLNNYAYYLSLRNTNLEKAEAMSKKSNDLEPNNNSYQDTYGWILYQMKKYDDAKTWIGKALDNGGRSNGTLLEHYGDVLYMLNDKDNAVRYWMDAKKAGNTTNLIDKKIADKKLYE